MNQSLRLGSILLSAASLLNVGCSTCKDAAGNLATCTDTSDENGASGGGGTSSDTDPSTGTGGSKSGVSSKPKTVYEWGKMGTEGSFDAGDWQVDNSMGVFSGTSAVHAPTLPPGDEASLPLDCGGKAHTQLSFVARRLTDGTELELFDGEVSRGLIAVGDWTTFVVDVSPGKHDYRLVARNLVASELTAPYVLDQITCSSGELQAGHNGFVTFDDGFVPLELGGDWFVDNLRGVHQGEAAVHAPALDPGDEQSMTFSCPATDMTQLGFVARRLVDGTELELFDGEQSRGKIQVGDWTTLVVDVPAGEHTFKLVARNLTTTRLSEPYALDTFVCKSEEPKPGVNGFVSLDEAFVPLEIGGDWLVDNLRGVHQGEAAIHPPVLPAEGESSMTFDCGGAAHTNFSFVARRLVDGTELELYEDGDSRGKVQVGDWTSFNYDTESAPHDYKLVARNLLQTELSEPYAIDTFACK